MTPPFSTLRGSPESVSVPPKTKGTLVTPSHYHCALSYNAGSGSSQGAVAPTRACTARQISVTQRSPTRRKMPLLRGSELPRTRRTEGGGGRQAKAACDRWQAGRPCACLPCMLRLSHRDSPYPVVKVTVTSEADACGPGESPLAPAARRLSEGAQRRRFLAAPAAGPLRTTFSPRLRQR